MRNDIRVEQQMVNGETCKQLWGTVLLQQRHQGCLVACILSSNTSFCFLLFLYYMCAGYSPSLLLLLLLWACALVFVSSGLAWPAAPMSPFVALTYVQQLHVLCAPVGSSASLLLCLVVFLSLSLSRCLGLSSCLLLRLLFLFVVFVVVVHKPQGEM